MWQVYKDQDFQIIAIGIKATRHTAQNWINRHGISYNVVYDSTGQICERFGGGWPIFVLLDRFMQFQDYRFFYPSQFDESYMCNQVGKLLVRKIRLAEVIFDDSLGNGDGILNCGESANLAFEVENACIQPSLDNLHGRLNSEYVHMIIEKETAVFNSIPVFGRGDNLQDPFVIRLDSSSGPHYAAFELVLETESTHKDTFAFPLPVGDPNILVVDDDGGKTYEAYYDACLFYADKVHHHWNMKLQGIQALNLTDYEIVIWFTGDEQDSTLTPEEQDLLTAYLDEGGHLIISGQNIGYDLVANGSIDDSLFYTNYLHANYVSDSIEETFLCGVQGDPITGNFPFLPIDESQVSPSVISPHEGASPIFMYHISHDIAAIKYEGYHKMLYCALGLEGINDMAGNNVELQGTLINIIIDWFNYIPNKGDVNQDNEVNILDVLQAINMILRVLEPTPSQFWAADCNDDEVVNILDVVGIVNVILGIGSCPPTGSTNISCLTIEYLRELELYLPLEDFEKLMSLLGKITTPNTVQLFQNYPNPFNPATDIRYQISNRELLPHVTLTIYNMLGQGIKVLVDEIQKPGYYTVTWNGTDKFGAKVASGMYCYRLTVDDFIETKRMVLLK